MNSFGGGGQVPDLDLTNNATEVFLDVLLLAASDLAHTPWESRFALWLARHDQALMGRGCVGFDLDEADWGEPSEYEARQDFVLRVVDAAYGRHRWNELTYEPAYAAEDLTHYRALVEEFVPHGERPSWADFPEPGEEEGVTYCVRHRIVEASANALRACRFCTQG